MNLIFFTILFISSVLVAKEYKPPESFELCSEFIKKNGVRLQLGQIWFNSGKDPKEAKQLENYSVDYNEKPFAHHFSFNHLPQEKLWINCVYFACGDNTCSSENVVSDSESVYHEIKKIPVSCKSKFKKENPTRIEYFNCKYK